MMRKTLCPYASRAMQEFMRNAVIGGTISDTPRGRSNLYSQSAGERAWGQTRKKRKSNGVLTHAERKYRLILCAVVFEYHSIFSNEIKETG